jgi:regulatory protein
MSKNALLDFGHSYRKAADYCALQDRCLSEVKLKLKLWNADSKCINEVIKKLIDENFLDEKRFAVNYARGKFRINGWGKIKIASSLKAKQIPFNLIQYSLSLIEPEEYNSYVESLLHKKIIQLGADTHVNRQKAVFFACSRGFEQGIIASVLHDNQLFDL